MMRQIILVGAIAAAFTSTAVYAQDPAPVTLPVQQVESARIDADAQGNPTRNAVSQQQQATPLGTPVSGYRGPDYVRNGLMGEDARYNDNLDAYGRPLQQTQAQNEVQSDGFIEKIKKNYKPEQSYDLKPGRNIIVPVGQGYMNVIKTNFTSLSARTSAGSEDAVLQIEEGNLYATVKTHQPVSLILSEDGVLDSEVSIVLVPLAAPPAIVNIDISLTEKMRSEAAEYQANLQKERAMLEAENLREPATRNASHVNNLVAILKPVAQGNIPRGFSMTNDIPAHLTHPCRIAVSHYTGQRLAGGREVIDVVLVRNNSNRAYQVREEMCLTPDVRAVGIFTKSYLMPGEETEVYIVRDKYYEAQKQREQTRPRLTGGRK
jgi:conjugal transfer pilus assembly protein TraK